MVFDKLFAFLAKIIFQHLGLTGVQQDAHGTAVVKVGIHPRDRDVLNQVSGKQFVELARLDRQLVEKLRLNFVLKSSQLNHSAQVAAKFFGQSL